MDSGRSTARAVPGRRIGPRVAVAMAAATLRIARTGRATAPVPVAEHLRHLPKMAADQRSPGGRPRCARSGPPSAQPPVVLRRARDVWIRKDAPDVGQHWPGATALPCPTDHLCTRPTRPPRPAGGTRSKPPGPTAHL